MAKVSKILKLQTGSFQQEGKERVTRELEDIGVLVEFEDREGNKFFKVKLRASILNPVLFQLVKPYMEKGSGTVWVDLFDIPKRVAKDSSPAESEDGESDEKPPF